MLDSKFTRMKRKDREDESGKVDVAYFAGFRVFKGVNNSGTNLPSKQS